MRFCLVLAVLFAGIQASALGQANNGVQTPGPNPGQIPPKNPVILQQTPTTGASAPVATTSTAAAANPRYSVSGIDLDYTINPDTPAARAQLPALRSILDHQITFGKSPEGGLTVPGTDNTPGKSVTLSIRSIGSGGANSIDLKGLEYLSQQIRNYINDRGYIGVFVAPNQDDIQGSVGTDLREGKRTRIRLVIYVATVESVRTLASGERVEFKDRLNNKLHQDIIDRSPIKADPTGKTAQLLNKQQLDDYILLLNRQPGRHVDVAVSQGSGDEKVVLDYLIAENRTFPPTIYIQGSNTGTKETQLWRERVGVDWDQLTKHDDNLTIDYVTSTFKDTNAVQTQYDFPISYDRKLRGRAFFDYSDFDANDLGLNSASNFSGTDLDFGGELAYTLQFRHGLFVDPFAGSAFAHYKGTSQTINPATGNPTSTQGGTAFFYRPYLGVRAEKGGDFSSVSGELRLTYVTSNSSSADIQQLGLPNASRSYPLFQGSVTTSFYLEPLFLAADSKTGSLAQELYFNIRGQSTFNHPGLAQDQQTEGGFYTVRGYPESFVAGDDAFIGTAEYRFHIPRAFPMADPDVAPPKFLGEPFRVGPTRKFGKPDWDLIARVFGDYGRTYEAQLPVNSTYANHYLLGVGTGLELQFRQNLIVRADWGIPLVGATDSNGEHVSSGRSSRLHFSATLVY